MLQLVAVAVLATLAYLFFRNTQRQMSRVRQRHQRDRKASEPVQTLERDPKTGVYRPGESDKDA